MGLEMPKLFVVLLDTLPVTGYRIDSDAEGAPPEGDWIPLEESGEVRDCRQPLIVRSSLGNCALAVYHSSADVFVFSYGSVWSVSRACCLTFAGRAGVLDASVECRWRLSSSGTVRSGRCKRLSLGMA